MADKESEKFFDDVKKGKARRFVMLSKGTKILCLILFKKGSIETYKQQAKQAGSGPICHGVITGKGQNLVFNLCRKDGFDSPPGKEITLKEYLKTEFGFAAKPTYAIVDELPSPDEGTDDDTLPTPEGGASVDVEALQQALDELMPGIRDFAERLPERRPEIATPTKLVKDFIAEPAGGSVGDVQAALQTIRQLLAEAPPQDESQESSPQQESEAPTVDPLAAKWESELPTVTQQMDAAIKKGIGDRQKMQTVMNYAVDKAEAGEYAAAIKSLENLAELIRTAEATAEGPIAAWKKVAQDAVFQTRRLQFALRGYEKELRDQLDAAAPEQAQGIKMVMSGALEIAEELDEIIGALQANPEGDGFIDSLQWHLGTEVVAAAEKPNPFNLKVDITGPVKKGLAELQAALVTS